MSRLLCRSNNKITATNQNASSNETANERLSNSGQPICWGIFFPFVFRFLTYLLSCILFLFALRYFVNYAPLLRAVCKFRYSLLSRPYLLLVFYVSISVTSFVEVDYLFPRWP